MNILALINGEYGERHISNIQAHAPKNWLIEIWQAPTVLPPVIDYPEDYLPEKLPTTDLILSFCEHKGVVELLPDIAEMTGASAVLAPVDNEAWLPRGLARQLHGWLERMDVACATPKPLCSLTERDYLISRRRRVEYDAPLISEFARYFGQPKLEIKVDPDTRIVASVSLQRDAVCGCARFVAEKLVGLSADDAEQEAGLAHHHYPCLASMGIDADFGDTLMHISGNIIKDEVNTQVKPFKPSQYIEPGTRSED
jgi:hypothetical protein